MSKAGKVINWPVIEQDYGLGLKTLRVIASEHGISNVAIVKRAKKEGWTRDLAERVRAKAQEKVSRAAVSSSVSKAASANENQVIEANANLQATVLLSHRKDLTAARIVVAELFDELSGASSGEIMEALELIMEQRVDEAGSEKAKDAIAKAYYAAMALPGRAGTAQRLAASLTSLIDSERTAFNIDDRTKGGNELVEALRRAHASIPVA